jgi:hypothetical protein
MSTPFHKQLAINVSQDNIDGANEVIMNELGRVAVHHRGDFVDLLTNSDVPANADMADAQLVKLYFENLHKKQLLIGTAFLVNMHNKASGFNGESEVSDVGVKTAYSSLLGGLLSETEIFTKHRRDWEKDTIFPELQSNFIWGAVAKGAVGATSKVIEGQHKKKYGALDAATARQKAKEDLAKSMIAQRQAQIEAATKEKERRSKNLRTGLWVGGIVVALGIGTLLYLKLRK